MTDIFDIYLLEAMVNGILLGGVLALLALGLNLIFGVIDVTWICYAELVMMGMYDMGQSPSSPSPGAPGEGGGEGSSLDVERWKLNVERSSLEFKRSTSNENSPHPYPLPAYREREKEASAREIAPGGSRRLDSCTPDEVMPRVVDAMAAG